MDNQDIMTKDLRNRFAKKRGPLKAEEIMEAGYTYKELMLLEKDGKIKKFKSGYYTCPDVELSEEEMVVSLFPDGVFTMESALYFHGYLKDRPFCWSVAVSKNTSKSRFKMDYPIVHPFYSEEKVLKFGVTKLDLPCGQIKLYDKDRLMCEVLKYEDKMDKEDFKNAVFSYINDSEKDRIKFLEYADKRRIINKARAVIGIWI